MLFAEVKALELYSTADCFRKESHDQVLGHPFGALASDAVDESSNQDNEPGCRIDLSTAEHPRKKKKLCATSVNSVKGISPAVNGKAGSVTITKKLPEADFTTAQAVLNKRIEHLLQLNELVIVRKLGSGEVGDVFLARYVQPPAMIPIRSSSQLRGDIECMHACKLRVARCGITW
jgi:hypothetical protein